MKAVERGCLLMLRSFVSSQIAHASGRFRTDVSVYATGGDAALIEDIDLVQRVPDLVFRGLAIACPSASIRLKIECVGCFFFWCF